MINANVIEAPRASYTVRFIANGEVIATETVSANGCAPIPKVPKINGKMFSRWDESVANVSKDMDVNAIFNEASYAVVYVDKLNGTMAIEKAAYNDPITKEYPEAPDGYECEGWDAQTVSGDMIVNALFSKKTYKVIFMDASGEEVVDTKTTQYGGAVIPPSYEYMTAGEGQRITGWSTDKSWWEVTEDMIVYPVVEYEGTTAAPYSSLGETDLVHITYTDVDVETEYPSLQLGSDTEDATIYYTTDGSEPVLAEAGTDASATRIYKDPIQVNSDMTVTAMAVAEGKNPSLLSVFDLKLEEIAVPMNDFGGFDEVDIDTDENNTIDDTDNLDKNLTQSEPETSRSKALTARTKNYGSVDDTAALTSMGKTSVISSTVSEDEAVITLVKGNKVALDGDSKSFNSTNKSTLGVNGKGLIKAKKPTGSDYVTVNYTRGGKSKRVKVRVIEPSLTVSSGSVSKLKVTMSSGADLDVAVNMPLNAQQDTSRTKNAGVIKELKFDVADDGKLHLTGKTASNGNASIPIYVNGKKFNIKIKVK